MTQINQLSAVSEVSDGDQFPIWSTANGDTRRAPASVVRSYMISGINVAPLVDAYLAANPDLRPMQTTYASPAATGFSVTLSGTDDLWLVLTPTGAFAAGTVVLPAGPVNRQLVQVSCSQAVTVLTVLGGSVAGAPTALAANGFFSMRFEAAAGIWRRVG